MMDVTNCKNCGGVLLDTGVCPYCGTVHKRVNTLEQLVDANKGFIGEVHNINLDLVLKGTDGTVYMLPLYGAIENIEMISDYKEAYNPHMNTVCAIRLQTGVHFEFEGAIRNDER